MKEGKSEKTREGGSQAIREEERGKNDERWKENKKEIRN